MMRQVLASSSRGLGSASAASAAASDAASAAKVDHTHCVNEATAAVVGVA